MPGLCVAAQGPDFLFFWFEQCNYRILSRTFGKIIPRYRRPIAFKVEPTDGSAERGEETRGVIPMSGGVLSFCPGRGGGALLCALDGNGTIFRRLLNQLAVCTFLTFIERAACLFIAQRWGFIVVAEAALRIERVLISFGVTEGEAFLTALSETLGKSLNSTLLAALGEALGDAFFAALGEPLVSCLLSRIGDKALLFFCGLCFALSVIPYFAPGKKDERDRARAYEEPDSKVDKEERIAGALSRK